MSDELNVRGIRRLCRRPWQGAASSVAAAAALLLPVAAAEGFLAAPASAVVGGQEVSPKFKYPFMVSLGYRGSHSCGGTVVAARWVITAAHCTNGATSSWTVRFHRHDLSKTDAEEQGRTYKVVERIKHPQYDAVTSDSDIALWKLDSDLPRGSIAALPAQGTGPAAGTPVRVIGWGTTSESGPLSPVLREATQSVVDHEYCDNAYKNHGPITGNMVCGENPQTQRGAACVGDSGGTSFTTGPAPELVGLVSGGEGCGRKGKPDVETRIAPFVSWIKNTTA
ncbi:serine protease [Streptomyces sp. NPDC056682]|uniref:serine protease n=1 Tax=Streptomyces sp. NPDC056682 TaxID=3345909 RepID=UPI0036A83A45